jgi:ketosteroid isomerase-like protein
MSQENVEIVRAGLEAFNRGDVQALAAISSPEITMQFIGVIDEPVHYGGAGGIVEYFRDQNEHWESFGFEIEDIRAIGERVLAIGTQTARGRASGLEVSSREAILVTVESGLVTSLQGYRDPEQALKAVGLAE